MMRVLMQSHAGWAIVPLQDILELGNEARMNTPSTCNEINWSWMVDINRFDDYRISRFAHLVKISGRNGMTFTEKLKELERQ